METGTFKHRQDAKPKRGIIGHGGKITSFNQGENHEKLREGWERIWGKKVKIVDNDPDVV